ncbi:MAG: hypothetical protein HKN16_11400 [Saprospiraceae bacterium]|nr:hypothetical protein [Saprospiraceae bacterium]
MRKVSTLLFLILFAFSLKSQQDTTRTWENYFDLEINARYGIPLDFFERNVQENLIGLGGSAMARINSNPSVFVGVDVYNFRFEGTNAEYFFDYYGYLEPFTARTRTSLTALHLKARVGLPGYRKTFPFIEAFLGPRYLVSKTTIIEEFDDNTEEQIDKFIHSSDWLLSYGGSIGVSKRIWYMDEADLMATFKVSYNPGTAGSYYVRDEDADLGLDPIDPYVEKFSTTNLLLVELGVTFAFGNYETKSNQ